MAGMTRKIDELDRVVIPFEMRRSLEIAEKDTLEIQVCGTEIVLRKVMDSCVFCGGTDNLRFKFRDKPVCAVCFDQLRGVGVLQRGA